MNGLSVSKTPIDEDGIAEYAAFFMNRSLSYHYDTVLLANTMNVNHHLDNRLQYDFLLNTVPPRKRYSKRSLDKEHHKEITAIQQYYEVTYDRARSIKKILNNAEIAEIINTINEKQGTK